MKRRCFLICMVITVLTHARWRETFWYCKVYSILTTLFRGRCKHDINRTISARPMTIIGTLRKQFVGATMASNHNSVATWLRQFLTVKYCPHLTRGTKSTCARSSLSACQVTLTTVHHQSYVIFIGSCGLYSLLITSAKEGMFYWAFICLSVCLSLSSFT